jgi:hypothetical protein
MNHAQIGTTRDCRNVRCRLIDNMSETRVVLETPLPVQANPDNVRNFLRVEGRRPRRS